MQEPVTGLSQNTALWLDSGGSPRCIYRSTSSFLVLTDFSMQRYCLRVNDKCFSVILDSWILSRSEIAMICSRFKGNYTCSTAGLKCHLTCVPSAIAGVRKLREAAAFWELRHQEAVSKGLALTHMLILQLSSVAPWPANSEKEYDATQWIDIHCEPTNVVRKRLRMAVKCAVIRYTVHVRKDCNN